MSPKLRVSAKLNILQAEHDVISAYLGLLLTTIITLPSSDPTRIIALLPGLDRKEKLQRLSASLEDLEGFRTIVQRHVKGLMGTDEQDSGENHSVVRMAIAELAALMDA